MALQASPTGGQQPPPPPPPPLHPITAISVQAAPPAQDQHDPHLQTPPPTPGDDAKIDMVVACGTDDVVLNGEVGIRGGPRGARGGGGGEGVGPGRRVEGGGVYSALFGGGAAGSVTYDCSAATTLLQQHSQHHYHHHHHHHQQGQYQQQQHPHHQLYPLSPNAWHHLASLISHQLHAAKAAAAASGILGPLHLSTSSPPTTVTSTAALPPPPPLLLSSPRFLQQQQHSIYAKSSPQLVQENKNSTLRNGSSPSTSPLPFHPSTPPLLHHPSTSPLHHSTSPLLFSSSSSLHPPPPPPPPPLPPTRTRTSFNIADLLGAGLDRGPGSRGAEGGGGGGGGGRDTDPDFGPVDGADGGEGAGDGSEGRRSTGAVVGVGGPGGEKTRFEWLDCTRYKPPRLPRVKRREASSTPARRKLGRNPRVPFSASQLAALEARFRHSQYLSSCDVAELSSMLNLTETRVKIWFQNRRARERRDREARAKGLPLSSSSSSSPSSSSSSSSSLPVTSMASSTVSSPAPLLTPSTGPVPPSALTLYQFSAALTPGSSSAFSPVAPARLLLLQDVATSLSSSIFPLSSSSAEDASPSSFTLHRSSSSPQIHDDVVDDNDEGDDAVACTE